MKEKLKKAIDCFLEKGKQIDGLYDLIIRGSGVDLQDDLIEGWSDLDASVIVERVDALVMKQVRELQGEILKVFPYKVSITLVSKSDFLSPYHHHGAKPIYYSYLLGNHSEKISLEMQKFDCLANIAYLIHDIRNKYVQLNMDDNAELRRFFCHLARRTGHFIRNALFILNGTISEKIDRAEFSYCFPEVDVNFLDNLESCKHRFKEISNYEEEINGIIDNLEKIHETLINLISEGIFKTAETPRRGDEEVCIGRRTFH